MKKVGNERNGGGRNFYFIILSLERRKELEKGKGEAVEIVCRVCV